MFELLIALAPFLFLGMAVTANQLVTAREPRSRGPVPMAAEHIYQGTLVFINGSGYATATAAGNVFAGVAVGEVDNSVGNAGDLTMEVYKEGTFLLVGSGFTQASIGVVAYGSDNYTATVTSTSNSKIGRFEEYVDSTHVYVMIDVQQV